MSDERFTIEESENQLIIFDNMVSDETYFHLGNDERDVRYVCDLLNVMNDTLLKQAEQNHNLTNKNIEQQAEIERLQKIIDLTTYQLKVQDRIIQMEEKE